MEKEFVDYELASRLMEMGFDEPCIAIYDEDTKKLSITHQFANLNISTHNNLSSCDFIVPAPLWKQVTDWLEHKEIFCIIDMRIEDGLFKWYPVVKTVEKYDEVITELRPRGKKIDALIDAINVALNLV